MAKPPALGPPQAAARGRAAAPPPPAGERPEARFLFNLIIPIHYAVSGGDERKIRKITDKAISVKLLYGD